MMKSGCCCPHFNDVDLEAFKQALIEKIPTLLKVCRICDEKITKQLCELGADHKKQLVNELNRERSQMGSMRTATLSA